MKTLEITAKTILVRVDLNVPLNDKLEVTDTTRLEAIKPTVDYLVQKNCKIVLISHLGRPQGQIKDIFSLKHIRQKLENILQKPVDFVEDCIGLVVKEKIKNLPLGGILLLENLRFYPQEEAGNIDFAKELASLADIYIQEAFGTVHRSHASTTLIANYLPACFGFLMEKEIKALKKILNTPKSPVLMIIGGAKVSTKVPIIKNLIPKVDGIIIGGGMAFTFLKAVGGEIGNSICEYDQLQLALDILELAKQQQTEIILPKDVVIADVFGIEAQIKEAPSMEIPKYWLGMDIGSKTQAYFSEVICGAQTIFWNGPMGVFEMSPFAKGTIAVVEAIAKATQKGAFSLVGGGDSIAAINKFGYAKKVSYISTGGGAMLESLEGRILPGIAAIENKKSR